MNNPLVTQLLRFLALVAIQLLVFKQFTLFRIGPFYLDVFVYPLFIMLLPLRTSREVLLLLAFALGIFIDWFYDSWGVHASACVFIAFVRPALLRALEPKGGYTMNYGLTIRRYQINWFVRYSAWMMLLFLAFYYSMEVFTPVYFLEIITKTITGFVSSMAFVLILMLIFNPED